MTRGGNKHNAFHPSRPITVPTVEMARRRLALDLSIVNHLNGPDLCKAGRLMYVPLMDVALEGHYGISVAERKALQRKPA